MNMIILHLNYNKHTKFSQVAKTLRSFRMRSTNLLIKNTKRLTLKETQTFGEMFLLAVLMEV